MELKDKVIAIGVTGGIAAYKMCEVVSTLVKEGADVHVVMTKNATQFVAPLTFQALSSNQVTIESFSNDYKYDVKHVSLAAKAELFVVAPCTANFAAKMACGIADDFLSTTVMASRCKVAIAPAMNTAMLHNAAYQANQATLISRGVDVISGDVGRLACGDVGEGRMAEPKEIVAYVKKFFSAKNDYSGKTVLITAGATIEPIDPVRYITNRSSGKMGMALCSNALARGAKVILIAGNMSAAPDPRCEVIRVQTTADMLEAVKSNLPRADIIIKAAAPADYCIDKISDQKIKAANITLNFKKNPDIAKFVGENKANKKLVIFSAETENLVQNATQKLKSKLANMVVANDVTLDGAGFNADTNIVTIITAKSTVATQKLPKTEIAKIILDKILDL